MTSTDLVTAECALLQPASHSDKSSPRFAVSPQNRQSDTTITSAHPVVPSLHLRFSTIFTDTHMQNYCGRRQFGGIPKELGWEKVPSWECLSLPGKQSVFLSVFVDDIKMAGKMQKMAPMWKKLMKDVDLDEPTSFLDHVYLGCTQTRMQTE